LSATKRIQTQFLVETIQESEAFKDAVIEYAKDYMEDIMEEEY